MARSQLLKDLVNSNTEIENIFLRLKIILNDFDNLPIMEWINGELKGYQNFDTLPKYRVIIGQPMGTFIVNNAAQYKNAPVPIDLIVDEDLLEKITTIPLYDSIGTVQMIVNSEDRHNLGRVIPTSLCHSISSPMLQILGMNINISPNLVSNIVSSVKDKLLEVIMELEKKYTNLDDLDISSQINEDLCKKDQVVYNIEKIIYEGNIEIGDKNKIKNSSLGNFLRRMSGTEH